MHSVPQEIDRYTMHDFPEETDSRIALMEKAMDAVEQLPMTDGCIHNEYLHTPYQEG